jgi:hypothetical protein
MRLTSINIIMGTLKELRCQKNIDVKCRRALRVNFIRFKLDTTFTTQHINHSLSFLFVSCIVQTYPKFADLIRVSEFESNLKKIIKKASSSYAVIMI